MIKGDYTYIKDDFQVYYDLVNSKCIIGKFCSISYGCMIFLGGEHNIDWVTTYPFGHLHTNVFNTFNGAGHPKTKGDIVIGNDVWIGAYVKILSGVKIGDGAIIGAGSVVTKDVEPYTIVGGNPAKEIRKRFSDRQIKDLLEIKWWDWDIEKINQNLPLMCSPNIDDFIDSHRSS